MLILFLPPPVHSRKTWIHRPTGIVRERSHMVGKEEEEGRRKKAQKKPLRRDQDLNSWTLSPEPGVLSIRPRRPVQEAWNLRTHLHLLRRGRFNDCSIAMRYVGRIAQLIAFSLIARRPWVLFSVRAFPRKEKKFSSFFLDVTTR